MSRRVNLQKTVKEIRALTVAESEHKTKLRARLLSDFGAKEKPMFTKMRFSLAACTICVLILAYALGVSFWTPKALAATIEALGEVRSMVCTAEIETEHVGESKTVDVTIYWSGDRARIDFGGEGQPAHQTLWVEPGKRTKVDYGGPAHPLATVELDSEDDPDNPVRITSADDLIEALRRSGSVDVSERRVEEGREVRILHLEQWNGLRQDVQLFVDPTTNLPVSVIQTFEGGSARQDYQWNVEIEPDLMRVRLPDGVIPKVIDASEQASPAPTRTSKRDATAPQTPNERKASAAIRAQCANNLKQLVMSCMQYANQHDGCFPDRLGDLYPDYADDLDVFLCPGSEGHISNPQGINEESSYGIEPGRTRSDSQDLVLIYEKTDHLPGPSGRHTCSVGGKVQFTSNRGG